MSDGDSGETRLSCPSRKSVLWWLAFAFDRCFLVGGDRPNILDGLG